MFLRGFLVPAAVTCRDYAAVWKDWAHRRASSLPELSLDPAQEVSHAILMQSADLLSSQATAFSSWSHLARLHVLHSGP